MGAEPTTGVDNGTVCPPTLSATRHCLAKLSESERDHLAARNNVHRHAGVTGRDRPNGPRRLYALPPTVYCRSVINSMNGSTAPIDKWSETSCLAHHRLHALDECRVEQDAARFHEMLNFEHFLVDGRVRCHQSVEGAPESQRALQIRWALPFGLGEGEIGDRRRRPWRFDQPGCLGEEGGREPRERVAFLAPEQTLEQQRLLGGHAHALAVYRVEAANSVAKRKQAARERFEPLEVAPDAPREAKADDVIEQFGVPDRVVQRRRPELLGEGQEPSASPGGLSSCRPPRVTIHLPPSSGNINAPRVLSWMLGSVRIAFQSDGASSGMANTAVA